MTYSSFRLGIIGTYSYIASCFNLENDASLGNNIVAAGTVVQKPWRTAEWAISVQFVLANEYHAIIHATMKADDIDAQMRC